jgi:RNA polymerase sigma-70 factor, ECF subfamily
MARYAELSSIELVKLCASSNDERAWTEFIRRFHNVIAAAVLKTSLQWGEPSQSQLDDLIQDTYLKLCESDNLLLRSFESRRPDSFYGFIKVVAANIVHDHFKSLSTAKRGGGFTEALTEETLYDSRGISSPDFEPMQRLQLAHIDKILRQVTAGKDEVRKRTVFWLRHRQGLTASEIASIPTIGLSTEGVESVLLRLATMIRANLATSVPHRNVKGLNRKNRFSRTGS